MSGPLATLGAPALLLWRSIRAAAREGLSAREVWVQTVELGTRSIWLVASGLGFFGTVLVTIAYAQARKYTGNLTLVGPAYFELMLREFSPMTVALLAASRAGAASSAELASMSVNEQVEALELSAADPLAELVAPRVLASVISLPALTCIGTVASTLAAAATVTFIFGADGASFMDARYVDVYDVSCALIKAVLCGLFIPLVACSRGLRARGGAAAVGEAVTSAVVEACMGCLVIDFVVALVFWRIGV